MIKPLVEDWMSEANYLRTLEPKGVLFLCVANSARSQLAEGIARSLAPKNVKVQSAGSEPTSVRPEAIRVLAEIDINIESHKSKDVNNILPQTVDTVITLCEQEVCPIFLGNAHRIHWGLPDPAAVEGKDESRLQSFRDVRDELLKRLERIWPQQE